MIGLHRLVGSLALLGTSLLFACAEVGPAEEVGAATDELGEVQQALTIRPGGASGHNMDFVHCANEGQTCATGTRYVAFGVGTSFTFKSMNGPFVCGVAAFGTDPAPGLVKACYYSQYQRILTSAGVPLVEGQNAVVSGGTVAYGANGFFNFRTFTGQTQVGCGNANFGDPLPGVAKACYQLADHRLFTSQGGSIVTFSTPFAYGVDGRFNFKIIQGSATCNDATFGDPFPGATKACYAMDETYMGSEGAPLPNGRYWYGSGRNGNYINKTVTGGSCTNASFGGDPDPGATKFCFGRKTVLF